MDDPPRSINQRPVFYSSASEKQKKTQNREESFMPDVSHTQQTPYLDFGLTNWIKLISLSWFKNLSISAGAINRFRNSQQISKQPEGDISSGNCQPIRRTNNSQSLLRRRLALADGGFRSSGKLP